MTETFQTPEDFAEFIILSMAATYGAPEGADRTTLWCDVGTDEQRLELFEQVEGFAHFTLSDEQRESVRTIGDLLDLLPGRADA